jgi:hypothetical protein
MFDSEAAPVATPLPLPTSASSWQAGANNGPIVPAQQPQQPVAPDLQANPVPMDAGEKLLRIAAALLPKRPDPQVQPQSPSGGASVGDRIPVQVQQSLRQRVASGIMSGVNAVGASLSDANVGTVPNGGGALTGVTRTLANRGQRLSEQESNQIMHAETQARTVALMRNVYRQAQEDRLQSYDQGSKFMDGLKVDHDVEANVSQDELARRVQSDPNFAHEYIVKATGEQQLFDANGKPVLDKNGAPSFSPLYSVASIQSRTNEPSTHTLTSDDVKFLTRNGAAPQGLTEGTPLTTTQWNLLYTRAHAAQDTTNQIRKANDDELSSDNMRQVRDLIVNDSDLQHYINQVPGQPLAGLASAATNAQAHIAAIDQQVAALQQTNDPSAQQKIAALQQQRQQFADQGTKIGKVVQFGFNDSAKQKYLDFQQKQAEDAEKVRHNKAEEQNKQAELAQKKQKGVISNLTGSDYLQTLPTAQRGIVQAVGEGRQKLPANRKEALALLEQVHQAYPDFDESKVGTWQKANNEYRGSGKTAVQIVPAYNTALEHMQDLFANTTAEGIFNPLSKAYQDREIALGYVAREVGKAVSAGAMTQKESEDLLNTLKGGLTPALKRERITKTAQLLHDKIDEYQTKFNDSAPSSAVKVPTLISPKAAQSYDFVTGKAQPQTAQPNIPTGATKIVPGPDGKNHYTNDQGTQDFGVAQ